VKKSMAMFKRPHHQKIAYALRALNGPLLRENNCLFAGGTVMTLRFGEYRESVDIDFLVSDITCYRTLRQMLTEARGISSIVREGVEPLWQQREIRADQYGIRTVLDVSGQPIKFEIVLEGRIELSPPDGGDEVCGIATLTPLDMAASKLLANSDRWADDGVFSRDVIDLAMMEPTLNLLRQAVAKAETAYGQAIQRDLKKAIDRLQQKHDRLERCMDALAITLPKALVWKNIRSLLKVIPKSS
jgi:hypothetical protein